MTNVINGCKSHYEQHPYHQKEKAKLEWKDKGIEGGMIVEVPPHLRIEKLKMGVIGCRRCHEDGEKCGIKGVYVAEVDYRSLQCKKVPYPVGDGDNANDDKEYYEVCVGEEKDKLRYGVSRHHVWDERRLACPSKL